MNFRKRLIFKFRDIKFASYTKKNKNGKFNKKIVSNLNITAYYR